MIEIDNASWFLRPEEFLVYCHLHFRYAPALGYTETSVDLLSNEIVFLKDITRNKQKVKEILVSLALNSFIEFDYQGIKNNTRLQIKFRQLNHGKTTLTREYLNIKNPREFFVLSILKRHYDGGNDVAYSSMEAWAYLYFNVSLSTAKKILDKIASKGLISIDHNVGYDEDGRMMSRYMLNEKFL